MRRVATAVLLAVGCAHSPAESGAPGWSLLSASPGVEEIQIRSDVHMRRATVSEAAVRGPDLELRRTDGKLQGTTYFRRPVDLQRRGNEIVGQVGDNDWDLRLSQDGAEVRVTGLVGGKPSTFWMSPGRIRGAVGTCIFDLLWSTGLYSGARTCGVASENVGLQLPAALATWSDPEVAALFGILVQR